MHTTAPIPSYQTVRLQRGKHGSPDQGVCVMELSSMLAGERFTDHPRSVCPVIGAFLRTYNDLVDDRRRQDLYAYAAEAVGTRGSREARRARGELCRHFLERWDPGSRIRLPRLLDLGPLRSRDVARHAAAVAATSGHPQAHSVALALIDALIACERPKAPAVTALAEDRLEVSA